MYRVFAEREVNARGKLLPRDELLASSPIAKPKLDPDKMRLIIEEAEGYLDADIPFLALSLYREFYITGNRNHFSNPYAKRREMLLVLSLAEYVEQKGRFASKLADVIWAMLEETSWITHAHASHNPANPHSTVPPVYNETELHGIDLYAGATAALMTMVLMLNRDTLDAMSRVITERIEYEIEKRVIRPFISHVPRWSGEYGSRCNNWCAWIGENMLFVAAFAEKRERVREEMVCRAMKYLDNFTASLPEDGGSDEGPGYWGAAAAAYFGSLELIYDMTGGKIDVFSHPHVRNMGEYIAKVNINDNKFVNFADCSPEMYPDGYLIMRYGERCGSESLLAFGKMMATKCAQRPMYRRPNSALRDLIMSMPTDAVTTKAEKAVWMPALKVMVARESEDTSRGMFLAIKGGHNQESHNHNDVGSYVIYHDGKPVIIDVGSCTYTRDTFGKNRYTIWCMQSHYHNLPAFDGIGELQGKNHCSTREIYDEAKSRLTLGLEEAYDKAAGVVSYTRIGTLDGGTVTVEENITLDAEREIDFRLMTHRAPKEIEAGKLLLAEDILLEYDTALEYTLEAFTPDNQDTMKRWGTPELYRMHFKTIAKEYNGKFIYKKL